LPDHATRLDRALRVAPRAAIAAAVLGVLLTWTSDGPVGLGGTEGPNNGWLVVIVAAFALGWLRALEQGSRVGVLGVVGSALVMAWTAAQSWLDARDVVGARPGIGLLLVLAAALVLAGVAVVRAVEAAG
jgi:hypothetical protein